jgi:hypothetical protein
MYSPESPFDEAYAETRTVTGEVPMPRLNQIIAVEKSAKSRSFADLSEAQ